MFRDLGYFINGFLCVFGLGEVPFKDELKSENKLHLYWDNAGEYVRRQYEADTAK